MKFLAPLGGKTTAYGVLTTPSHRSIPSGILDGKPWAADNEAFTKLFNPGRFFSWIKLLEPYRSTCIFVSVPDVVGNAQATLNLFEQWRPSFDGWPVAFVAQDGMEDLCFPEPLEDFTDWISEDIDPDDDVAYWAAMEEYKKLVPFSTLFIGGSTEWKESMACVDVIRRGQELGVHIHIGRVNYKRRYQLFRVLKGSENFTCDGTRTRYEGKYKTLSAWRNYESQKPLISI